MIQPKYSVLIQVYTFPGRLHFHFSRPIDNDLMSELRQLEQNQGFDFTQIIGLTNQPWCLSFPPTYDALEVAEYIEGLLKKHGHEKLFFKCDIMHNTKEASTASELKKIIDG